MTYVSLKDDAQLPQDITQLPQDVTQLPQDGAQLPQDVTQLPVATGTRHRGPADNRAELLPIGQSVQSGQSGKPRSGGVHTNRATGPIGQSGSRVNRACFPISQIRPLGLISAPSQIHNRSPAVTIPAARLGASQIGARLEVPIGPIGQSGQ